MAVAQIQFLASDGTELAMDISHSIYQEAAKTGINVHQLINRKAQAFAHAEGHGGVSRKHGDAFTQALIASGMITNAKLGEQSMTMSQIMAADFNSSTTRAPSGDDTTTAAQVLYPQTILEAVARNSIVDKEGFLGTFGEFMAETVNVTSARIDTPIINFKSSEDAPSGHTAQLSAPPTMMEITVSETQNRIPTMGIGLMVSKEAMEASTIDLMALAISRQAIGQRVRMAKDQINTIINGDPNQRLSPLKVHKFSEFDASNGGKFTKLGWLKMLRQDRYEWTRTRGLLTFDTAVAMDNALTDSIKVGPDAHKIVAPFQSISMDLPNPAFLDMEDNILGSAGRIVLVDPTAGMRRMVNVSAEYEGIEEFIMRKASGFRADHGELVTRLFDEAFLVVDLNL